MASMTLATRFTGRLALAASLSVLACQHPVKQRLEGTWRGEGVENIDNKHLAAATGWAKGTALEFSGSRIKIALPAEEPRSGRYSVVKVEGDRVLLAVQDSEQRDRGKLRMILDQAHLLRWDIGDSRYVIMRLVEPGITVGL